MKISVVGTDLIKSFEGLQLRPYLDSAGIPTIGYGHTLGVTLSSPLIDQQQADKFLLEDLEKVERAIGILVQVPVNQNQYDALCSFLFNVGVRAFRNSTLRRKLNREDYLGASEQFKRWNKAGGKVLSGLTRRRDAEATLFLQQ